MCYIQKENYILDVEAQVLWFDGHVQRKIPLTSINIGLYAYNSHTRLP